MTLVEFVERVCAPKDMFLFGIYSFLVYPYMRGWKKDEILAGQMMLRHCLSLLLSWFIPSRSRQYGPISSHLGTNQWILGIPPRARIAHRSHYEVTHLYIWKIILGLLAASRCYSLEVKYATVVLCLQRRLAHQRWGVWNVPIPDQFVKPPLKVKAFLWLVVSMVIYR